MFSSIDDAVTVAGVAVSKIAYSADCLYSYVIPKRIMPIGMGQVVLVPFGRSSKKRLGVVYELQKLTNNTTQGVLREIDDIIDTEFKISECVLKLSRFVKERCFCTFFSALKSMVPMLSYIKPTNIIYKLSECYIKRDDTDSDLDQNLKNVLLYLGSKKNGVTLNTLKKYFPDNIEKYLEILLRNGAIEKKCLTKKEVKNSTKKIIGLSTNFDVKESKKLSSLQKKVLNLVKDKGKIYEKELLLASDAKVRTITSLISRGLIYCTQEQNGLPNNCKQRNESVNFNLNEEQNKVYRSLYNLYKKNESNTALLFGITGSGKTAIYMKLIDEALLENKGVIVLLPEIALTTQIINKFYYKYGQKAIIYHSALSFAEKMDKYRKIESGDYKIIIGTRSAIFLPVKNLGLIIIDEEHESSYKSENAPKYNTKEVAKYRCYLNRCLLLLISATPSVEEYYMTKTGKSQLFTLKERYGKAKLPEVRIVDMNKELASGNITLFSNYLLNRINENIKNNRQSIILVNRRGHSTFLFCRKCQNIIFCPRCSVSLAYHVANNKLICHRCGFYVNNSKNCPICNSSEIKFSGVGTQKIEKDLLKLVPQASILRMDSDVNLGNESYEKKLDKFKKKEYNIMVGTQIVAKGLDFPDVTLVAVLCADQSLNCGGYKSFERSFALFTQVIGRAGRKNIEGEAIIQTFNPENSVIKLAAKQSYEEFFDDEIKLRKALIYPPFVDLCVMMFKGENEAKVRDLSLCFFEFLKNLSFTKYNDLSMIVLSPSSAEIVKVNNKYRYKIVIKYKNKRLFRKFLKEALVEFPKEKNTSGVTISPDINPSTII